MLFFVTADAFLAGDLAGAGETDALATGRREGLVVLADGLAATDFFTALTALTLTKVFFAGAVTGVFFTSLSTLLVLAALLDALLLVGTFFLLALFLIGPFVRTFLALALIFLFVGMRFLKLPSSGAVIPDEAHRLGVHMLNLVAQKLLPFKHGLIVRCQRRCFGQLLL